MANHYAQSPQGLPINNDVTEPPCKVGNKTPRACKQDMQIIEEYSVQTFWKVVRDKAISSALPVA
jgi:hypothetical protein